MKNYNLFRTVLLSIAVCGQFLAASCQKAEIGSEPAKEKFVLNVRLPELDQKTAMQKASAGYKTVWSAGDVISINGHLSKPLETGGESGASFEFEGFVPEDGDTCDLLYPGATDQSSVTVPVFQSREGNLIPICGSGTYPGTISMKNLCAVLRFGFTGEIGESVRYINVTANGGEKIGGVFNLVNNEGQYSLSATESATDYVSIYSEEGVALGSTAEDFYVAIPAGTYSGGFTAKVYTVSGGVMELKFWTKEGPKTLSESKVYTFPDKAFVAGSTAFVIATPEDLVTFATTMGGSSNAGKNAIVIRDIDMTGTAYSPHKGETCGTSNLSSDFNYYGNLDGGFHKISGLTSPLFNNFYGGEIKNLEIDASIDYTVGGNSYGIGLLAHYLYNYKTGSSVGLIDNVTVHGSLDVNVTNMTHHYHVGGIAGASNGVPVRGCKSYVDIDVAECSNAGASIADIFDLGGVVGLCQGGDINTSSAPVTSCENYGNLLAGRVLSTRFNEGGVVGRVSGTAAVMSYCDNYGAVKAGADTETADKSVKPTSDIIVGGVLGFMSVKITISNCSNAGEVYVGNDVLAGAAIYVAGITGTQCNDISGCSNSGDITVNCTNTPSANCSMGGIVGRCQGKLSNSTNSGTITAGKDLNISCANALYIAGIAGNVNHADSYVDTATNTGDVIVEGKVTKGNIASGCVVGEFSNGSNPSNLKNEGGNLRLTENAEAAGNVYAGGVAGNMGRESSGAVCDGGSVYSAATAGGAHYVGGVAGNTSKDADGYKNIGASVEYAGKTTSSASYLGGVIGYSATAGNTTKNLENSGNVTFSSGASSKSYLYFGGIAGYSHSFMDNCINNGNLLLDGSASNNTTFGGIVGRTSSGKTGKFLSNLTNNGTVTVGNNTTLGSCSLYLGGIVGDFQSADAENLVNTGKITANTKSRGSLYLGGLIGHVGQGGSLSNLTNETGGAIEIVPVAGKLVRLGGVAGYTELSTVTTPVTYSGLVNKAPITINGPLTYSTESRNCIGGVIGLSYAGGASTLEATVSGSSNSGAITINSAAGTKSLNVGGIFGEANVYSLVETTTHNSGNISVKAYPGNVDSLSMGGHIGHIWRHEGAALSEVSITGDATAANSGKLYLEDGTADDGTTSSKFVVAGGIIGFTGASAMNKLSVTITGCKNSGAIDRRTYVKANTAPTGADYMSLAGGIAGTVGHFSNGGYGMTYVTAVIENCENTANVKFNRYRGADGTWNPGEPNSEAGLGTCYNGGVVGLSYSYDGCTIRSCRNSGNVLSSAGKNGGIVGIQRKNTTITGTAASPTVNSGRVGHYGASTSWTAPSKYLGYTGGITGYLFGSADNTVEYCSVESSCITVGNYGCGGIAGQFCSSADCAAPTVRYVKVAALNRASSTAAALNGVGKAGLLFGSTPKIEAWANVSDIAVGGTLYKGNPYALITPTAANFTDYLAGVTYQLPAADCPGKNIVFWDGTSKTSWED